MAKKDRTMGSCCGFLHQRTDGYKLDNNVWERKTRLPGAGGQMSPDHSVTRRSVLSLFARRARSSVTFASHIVRSRTGLHERTSLVLQDLLRVFDDRGDRFLVEFPFLEDVVHLDFAADPHHDSDIGLLG